MRYSLRILPAAGADVDNAAAFIARDSLDFALRFYDAIDVVFRDIRDNPLAGRSIELDHKSLTKIRKRSVKGFRNHLVFYRVEGGKIEIIRVLHGARDISAALIYDSDVD